MIDWLHTFIEFITKMVLNESDLYALTKKKQSKAQASVLNALSINFVKRPDGSLIVSHLHVQQVLGADLSNVKLKQVEPDWSVINA